MKHKIHDFIIKSLSQTEKNTKQKKGGKKRVGKGKGGKREMRNVKGLASDGPETVWPRIGVGCSMHGVSASGAVVDDSEVVWFTDTSKDAVRARAEE
jgi:hypothetical protein